MGKLSHQEIVWEGNQMQKSVLILGASGRFGHNAHAAFSWAGWNVTCFDRQTDSLPDAAWGADVIVNAWNPAYPDWAEQLPKLTAQIIETAKATGAAVLIPGNIYVYGDPLPSVISAASPHLARNPLGKLRLEMEAAYRDASVKTIILRAGDFIDTDASGNWYDKIITAKLAKARIDYPGDPDTPHAWAYLPDLADAAVALCDKADTLEQFTDVLFPGLTLSGRALGQVIGEVLETPIEVRSMSWLPIQLARPFWPMARYLLEMRYLWEQPHEIDSAQFNAVLPDFEPTPVYEAIAASLPEDIHPNRPVPRAKSAFGFGCGPFNCAACNPKSS
jgi:nucleoside-diphosphate-sugar epimerase